MAPGWPKPSFCPHSLTVRRFLAPKLIVLFSFSFGSIFCLGWVRVQLFVFLTSYSNQISSLIARWFPQLLVCGRRDLLHRIPYSPTPSSSPDVKCVYNAFSMLQDKINCIKGDSWACYQFETISIITRIRWLTLWPFRWFWAWSFCRGILGLQGWVVQEEKLGQEEWR